MEEVTTEEVLEEINTPETQIQEEAKPKRRLFSNLYDKKEKRFNIGKFHIKRRTLSAVCNTGNHTVIYGV